MSCWKVRWSFQDKQMTERVYNNEDGARRVFSKWKMIEQWAVELVLPNGKTERRESTTK